MKTRSAGILPIDLSDGNELIMASPTYPFQDIFDFFAYLASSFKHTDFESSYFSPKE